MQQTDHPLKTFYSRALGMLAEPVSNQRPPDSPYPDNDMPSFVVHFGPLDKLPPLRAKLPPSCFLLGIHADPCDIPVEGRTFLARIGTDDISAMAGMLTSILPEKNVRLIDDKHYREQFRDDLDSVQDTIRRVVQNDLSERRRGLIRLRAACHNLRQMTEGPRVIPAVIPPDVPVILCGAGPSLADQLTTIQALKDSVVIAAVGHAVRSLDQAGIVPDLIVEGDSQCGINWPEELKPDSVLVATTEVAPDVAARFEHVMWCEGSSPPFNQTAASLKLPLLKVSLNKTVSVHALDFLLRMGCRKVALIGQDYCYGSDGRLYAEPSKKATGTDSVPLPAATGEGHVASDTNLESLWTAFNAYLDEANEVGGVELTNCSDGAALNHTSTASLSEWGATCPPSSKPSRFFSTRPAPEEQSDIPGIVSAELKQEMDALETILKSCRNLLSELNRHPVKMSQVKRKQEDLQNAIQAETETHQAFHCIPWIHTVSHIADQIMKKTPGMISEEPDPATQLNYLIRRYRLVSRLCQDLLNSIDGSVMPRHFSAYLEENLTAVARNNPALANRLRELSTAGVPDGFALHWFNQLLPYLRRDSIPLSGESNFFYEAREVVDQFIQETHFHPATHALTVLAPANYAYAVEFLRRFPQLELVIIDPWPQVLAQIISGGCFLHQLPQTACIVTTWADPLYVSRRTLWKQAGLQEVRFISPHVADFPDVVALQRNLALLP